MVVLEEDIGIEAQLENLQVDEDPNHRHRLMLLQSVQEQENQEQTKITFKAGHSSLKSFFDGGCLSPGQNSHHYAIPLVQRPYEWPASNVHKLMDSLHFTYENSITCYTLGNVFVWKKESNAFKYYLIDGQQRMTSIVLLIAVIRHVYKQKWNKAPPSVLKNALVFEGQENDDGDEVELKRFVVKRGQQEFFETYITSEEDQLHQFWDDEGRLQLHLAGNDTVAERYMKTVDTIKTHLETLTLRGDKTRKLVDSEVDLSTFVRHVMQNVHVAFSEAVGGGDKHMCICFCNANDTGLVLTLHDTIKASVMSKGTESEREAWGEAWDKYFAELSRYEVKSDGAGKVDSAFSLLFQTIRELRIMRQPLKSLHHFFSFGADDGFKVLENPNDFMEHFFLPLAKAFSRIFGWRQYQTTLAAGQEPGPNQIKDDLINSRIASLARLFSIAPKEQPAVTSCWLPVLVMAVLQFSNDRRQFGELLRAIETRATWHFVGKEGKQGGPKFKKHMQDTAREVLKLFNPTVKLSASGAVQYVQRIELEQQSHQFFEIMRKLSLKDADQRKLADAMIGMEYKDSHRRSRTTYILRMYDDMLRHGENPIKLIGTADYDDVIRRQSNQRLILTQEHFCPQNMSGRDGAVWRQSWSDEVHGAWCNNIGNLLLLARKYNLHAGNKGYVAKYQKFAASPVAVYSTQRVVDYCQADELSWRPENVLGRFRDILNKVFVERLRLKSDILEDRLNRWLERKPAPESIAVPPSQVDVSSSEDDSSDSGDSSGASSDEGDDPPGNGATAGPSKGKPSLGKRPRRKN